MRDADPTAARTDPMLGKVMAPGVPFTGVAVIVETDGVSMLVIWASGV
ncbi:MAG: hypothetical protein Q4G32_10990 [Kocuria sp.]|nr:hypothetical protein [Kocuria sp.]